MAAFYEYTTDIAQKAAGPVICQAWSCGDPAVLAVSTRGGNVSCFLEEGERLDPDVSISRGIGDCSVLSWHPKHLTLAYGWTDGSIGVWTEKERSQSAAAAAGQASAAVGGKTDEAGGAHKAAITLLCWSPHGNRLISGDASGLLIVWAADHRARLTQICQYQKSGQLTHLVFRAPAVTAVVDDAKVPCPPFFFGSASGHVYFADDLKHCSDVVNLGAPVNVMYYSHSKSTAAAAVSGSSSAAAAVAAASVNEPGYLVIVAGDATLYKYKIGSDSRMAQERKVKLSIKGDGSELQCVWAGSGLLAAANNEAMLRLWHQEKDLNYVLTLNDPRHGMVQGGKDLIRCVAFNPRKRVLAGGTHSGRIVMWRYTGGASPSEDDWEILPPIKVSIGIYNISWGPGESLLAVSSAESKALSILNETVMAGKTTASGNSVIQTSADRFVVSNSSGKARLVAAGIRIKGIDLDALGKYVLIYNGKRAEIREIKEDIGALAPLSQFASRAKVAAVYRETIYACVGARIEVMNFQGIVKKILTFSETEGSPAVMDVWSDFLVVATTTGIVKLWNIKRAEPVQVVPGRAFDELGVIKSVRVNCSGTKISILCNKQDDGGMQVPDSRIHVYEVETDKLLSHQFPPKYYPINHVWDRDEHKLLVVETRRMELNIPTDGAAAAGAAGAADKKDSKTDAKSDIKIVVKTDAKAKAEAAAKAAADQKDVKSGNPMAAAGAAGAAAAAAGAAGGAAEDDKNDSAAFGAAKPNAAEVTTLFATSYDEGGVLMQDSFAIDPVRDSLIGVDVPYIQFMYRPTEADDDPEAGDGTPRVRRRPLRDFVGLETVGAETRKDLLNFSYQLTVGNMDEAYRAVKKISSVAVWENMAQMCVKTKRLDVAETCLGNMGNARGARAVRLAKLEPEKDAAVAMVAIQLGLLDDAERLYAECGRWDLLVELYISCGRWEDALRTCAKHDRIHLKTVHYQYARHLEATGDQGNSIKQYEKSDTHKHEVPRMLFDAQHIGDLEAYIKASDDPALIKWWAQYCESNGAYDDAIRYYELAKERLALVRVYWYRGDDEKAAELCTNPETSDAAACYHLARQYESQDKIKQAIAFYTKAKRFNHGVRLAKEHGLENELLTLALEGTKELKVDAAKYFEDKGLFDKAVLLYQKGGRVQRALQLCFRAQLFDSLRAIAEELDANADPALLSRCGEFFLENKQYDKAVSLFVTARNFDQALELCAKHNVKVDEKMADKMTPPPATTPEEKKHRDAVLTRIATLCHDQRSYHLACKKFTQAGDKERAMKCLLKSDDTDKITAYASMTKNNAVYVLAANHLQKLDWYNNAELMKTIIQFYAKARAMRELSAFYDSCALHEIDDFRDYEKALDALREALKYAIKSKPAADRDAKLNSLESRIKLVEKFVSARKLVKTNGAEMVRLCTQLLDTPDVESAVRVGDVYAELISYYMSISNMQSAYQVIQRMRSAGIVLDPYLDRSIVESIHAAVGVPLPGGGAAGSAAAPAAGGSAGSAAAPAPAAGGHGPNVMHLGDGGDGGDGEVIDEAVTD